jgi:hypothetical protein
MLKLAITPLSLAYSCQPLCHGDPHIFIDLPERERERERVQALA